MTATVTERQRPTLAVPIEIPDKPCRACGASFYTNVGLAEHIRQGCGNGRVSPVTVRRLWRLTPEGRESLRQTGLNVTALNNSRRYRCADCDKVSTPGGIGIHQRATGHTGRLDL